MSKNELDMNYISLSRFLLENKENELETGLKFIGLFSLKRREFLNILSSIKRNYKNSGYYLLGLQSKGDIVDLKTPGKRIGRKYAKIVPYTDLESKEAYEAKLFEKYTVEESMRKYQVTGDEREKEAFHKFEVTQRELLRNFFKPYTNNPLKNYAVKLIKQITGYNGSIDLLSFIQKKRIIKKIQFRIGSKFLKIVLKRGYFKKELINQQKKLNNDLQKLVYQKKKQESQSKYKVSGVYWNLYKLYNNPKLLFKPFLKLLPIIGLFFSVWFTLSLNEAYFLPTEVTSQFLLLPVVYYFFYSMIVAKGRILSSMGRIYFLLTSLGLPIVLSMSVLLGWLDFARLYIPVFSLLFSLVSFFVASRQAKVPSRPKEHKFLKRIKTARYHQVKFPLLWFFLFVFTISLCFVFIIVPQWQFIPVMGIIGAILFFTIQSRTITRNYQRKRRLRSRDQGYISQKEDTYFELRHARAAYLMLVFLMCFPLIFAVNSLVSINSPEMSYAKVPNFNRIEGTVDFSTLGFYSSLGEVDSLSINDEFAIKCKISPFLGETVIVRIRFTPKDVEPIEGFHIKGYYEKSSGYVGGPKYNYDMITRVPLNSLNLAPGTYQVDISYNVLTGFSYRTAPSDSF